MKDEPAPARHGLALLQVENGSVCSFRTKRGEARRFSAIKDVHAEYVTIKLHGGFHVRDPDRHRRNLLNRGHGREFTCETVETGNQSRGQLTANLLRRIVISDKVEFPLRR